MEVLYTRCCGLDVHRTSVVACVLVTQSDGKVSKQVRSFRTMTADLLVLSDWLGALGVTHVAMESTGVYWQPIYAVLDAEDRTLLLVNAQHIKAVPGRKTDVKDAEWLADLVRHGLVRGSFVPPQPVRALRDLTRYRTELVRARAQEVNRVAKVLDSANVKLGVVATDVLGVSGRAMIEALIGGEQDPVALAELARGRLRAKLPDLRLALEGRLQPQQRVLLRHMLAHITFLEEALAQVQQEIAAAQSPLDEAAALLQTIPGVGERVASIIVAEIGTDMGHFPTPQQLASWAGVCPGNRQSGGKRLSGRVTHGNAWLRSALVEAAWATSHGGTPPTYLAAQYHRLARRRGKTKAILAVAHSILVICWHVLQDHQPYHELGADYFERLDPVRLEHRYIHRLERLGYAVTLTPLAGAS